MPRYRVDIQCEADNGIEALERLTGMFITQLHNAGYTGAFAACKEVDPPVAEPEKPAA